MTSAVSSTRACTSTSPKQAKPLLHSSKNVSSQTSRYPWHTPYITRLVPSQQNHPLSVRRAHARRRRCRTCPPHSLQTQPLKYSTSSSHFALQPPAFSPSSVHLTPLLPPRLVSILMCRVVIPLPPSHCASILLFKSKPEAVGSLSSLLLVSITSFPSPPRRWRNGFSFLLSAGLLWERDYLS